MTRTLNIVGEHFSQELSQEALPATQKKMAEEALAQATQKFETEIGTQEIAENSFRDAVRQVRQMVLRSLQSNLPLHTATSNAFDRLVFKI